MRGFKSSQTPRTWLHTGTGGGVQVSQSEAWSSTDTSPQTSRLQSCQWIGDSAIAVTHSQPEGSLTPLPQSRRYDTRTKAAGFCFFPFLFFFLTLCLEIYTLQEENMLFFYFIVSFFQLTFKKKKEKKKALIIYQHLLHTFLVYADFLLLLHFLLSSTETCTVNVDVHNFFLS